MVQRSQPKKPQTTKAQYGEMIRWQRELLMAEKALEKIAIDQGIDTPTNTEIAHDHALAEDRRLAYFQKLCSFNPEQHRQAHFKFKQERERLVRDIRDLHQLVAGAL